MGITPRERVFRSESLVLMHDNQDFGLFFSKASSIVRDVGFKIRAVPLIEDIALLAVKKFDLPFQDVKELLSLVLEQVSGFEFRHQKIGFHIFALPAS